MTIFTYSQVPLSLIGPSPNCHESRFICHAEGGHK